MVPNVGFEPTTYRLQIISQDSYKYLRPFDKSIHVIEIEWFWFLEARMNY